MVDFKREAVRLVQRGARPAAVAKQLGISEQTLANWRKAEVAGKLAASRLKVTPEEMEFSRLRVRCHAGEAALRQTQPENRPCQIRSRYPQHASGRRHVLVPPGEYVQRGADWDSPRTRLGPGRDEGYYVVVTLARNWSRGCKPLSLIIEGWHLPLVSDDTAERPAVHHV